MPPPPNSRATHFIFGSRPPLTGEHAQPAENDGARDSQQHTAAEMTLHTNTHKHTQTHTNTHKHTQTHTNTHTHTHTHKHTHTHVEPLLPIWLTAHLVGPRCSDLQHNRADDLGIKQGYKLLVCSRVGDWAAKHDPAPSMAQLLQLRRCHEELGEHCKPLQGFLCLRPKLACAHGHECNKTQLSGSTNKRKHANTQTRKHTLAGGWGW